MKWYQVPGSQCGHDCKVQVRNPFCPKCRSVLEGLCRDLIRVAEKRSIHVLEWSENKK